MPQIGRELAAKGLIEGAVFREGDQVRITVQLIDAASDRRIWGSQFTREMRSVLDLQSEVARAIAAEIKATVTPQELGRLAAARPVNPRAFELYLLGRDQWNRRTVQAVRQAVGSFREALRLDSTYAPAQAALGEVYLWLGEQGGMPQSDACELASAPTRAALEMDESLADAQVVMGMWQVGCNWSWQEAEGHFHQALGLNPGSAAVHQYYGRALSRVTRRLDEGLRELQRAEDLDPLSPAIRVYVGQNLLFGRQFEAAAAPLRDALALNPDHALVLHTSGELALAQGHWQEAVALLERSLQQPGQQSSHYLAVLGAGYAHANRRSQAIGILDELRRRAASGLVSEFDMALLLVALGDQDEALTALERGYANKDMWLPEMLAWPWFDPLGSTSRFQAIVRKMQLPW